MRIVNDPTNANHAVRVPDALANRMKQSERNGRLDVPARLLDRAAGPLADGPAGPWLKGDWLGHAVHPLLTDLPLGCWLASAVLDGVGGRTARGSSQRL